MTADPKCYHLAEAFLEDHTNLDPKEHLKALAEAIQRAIEEYIEEVEG